MTIKHEPKLLLVSPHEQTRGGRVSVLSAHRCISSELSLHKNVHVSVTQQKNSYSSDIRILLKMNSGYRQQNTFPKELEIHVFSLKAVSLHRTLKPH